MLTFLKTVAVIAVMVLIIPLSVWAGSGNWRHGLHALKAYLRIMAFFVIGGAALAAVFLLGSLGAS